MNMLADSIGILTWGITQMANGCPVTKWTLREHYVYVASLVVAMRSLQYVNKLNISF